MKPDRKPLCRINKANATLTILTSGEEVPMRDLQGHVAFHIKKTHLDRAVPHDPCKCAISNAITDAVGAELVVTLAHYVIYVVKEPKGKVAYRGKHSLSSRAILEANDRMILNKSPHGHFFIQPVTKAERLKSTKKYNRKRKEQRAGRLAQTGKKHRHDPELRTGQGYRTF